MGPDAAVGLDLPPRAGRRRTTRPRAGPNSSQEYEDLFASPYQAASRGYIDDVIEPRQTRPWLIQRSPSPAPNGSPRQPGKHGNIPL